MTLPAAHEWPFGTRSPARRARWLAAATALAVGWASTGSAMAAQPGVPPAGRSGLDLTALDRRVAPGADFFDYANGAWMARRDFAPDETYVGARADLVALRKRRVRELVENAASETHASAEGRLVADLYGACLATPDGTLGPLQGTLSRIDRIGTQAALFALFADAPTLGIGSPLGGFAFYDFHTPGWMRYTLEPGGLALPTREVYLDDTPRAQALRDGYLQYATDVLRIAGDPHPDASAREVLALETALARVQWPTPQARNFLKTANSLTVSELQVLTPDFDWRRYLRRAGVPPIDVVIVRQPDAMAPLLRVIRSTPLATWRAWARVQVLTAHAAYLGGDLAARQFAFFGTVVEGQDAPSPRWQLAVDTVERLLGQAVGRMYVARYFPESHKARVAAMFADIQAVMRERVERATWMSDSTRREALRKLDTLVVKIGYPDEWPRYAGLRLEPTDCVGNLTAARRFAWRQRLAGLAAPVDRRRWQTTPQSSGAAANPTFNEITVPAGALERPYFDAQADDAVNYGAIGGVLAHELSHMFDQVGRQIDATGRLRDWWAPADAERYERIAALVEAHYAQFEALPGLRLDGRLTLNENIADIAGLNLAWLAYQRRLGGVQAPVLDGLSAEQRFFLGWAQMRAGKQRDAALRQQVAAGPHAPDRFRVNGAVPHVDAWYAAFAVTDHDPMYRAPESRAHFW